MAKLLVIVTLPTHGSCVHGPRRNCAPGRERTKRPSQLYETTRLTTPARRVAGRRSAGRNAGRMPRVAGSMTRINVRANSRHPRAVRPHQHRMSEVPLHFGGVPALQRGRLPHAFCSCDQGRMGADWRPSDACASCDAHRLHLLRALTGSTGLWRPGKRMPQSHHASARGHMSAATERLMNSCNAERDVRGCLRGVVAWIIVVLLVGVGMPACAPKVTRRQTDIMESMARSASAPPSCAPGSMTLPIGSRAG